MKHPNHSRRGSTLLEFSLVGIPQLFIVISVISAGINMWQFSSLAYASESTARYISVHGNTCSINGNSCLITIGNAASYFKSEAPALDVSKVIVKFTDGSGTTTTCNPLSTCTSSNTTFPNTTYNGVGQDVTVKATYQLVNPIILFWPPREDDVGTFVVGANSRQRILF